MSQSYRDHVDAKVYAYLRQCVDAAPKVYEISQATGVTVEAVNQSLCRLRGLGLAIDGDLGGSRCWTLSQEAADRVRASKAATKAVETDDDDTTADSDGAASDSSSVAAHAARRRPATTPTVLRAVPPAAKSGLWAAD